MEQLLTMEQAAAVLGLKRTRVSYLISSRQLPAFNVSVKADARRPTWRIRQADLEAFLAGRSTRPPKQAERRTRPAAEKPVRSWV